MKKVFKYLLVFILGVLVALLYFKKEVKKNETEQIQVMLNEIKNVSKLVVTETAVSQMYNYQSADNYLFETITFKKKVIVVVNAKVQIAYDLSKMVVETDSVNKKIIIKSIPKEETLITPDVKYYDFEQSTFNQFTKEELNLINKKSIDKIKKTIEISTLKTKAQKQLLSQLKKLYNMTNLLNWELVDQTEQQILISNFKT